jgi:hypothetical protein
VFVHIVIFKTERHTLQKFLRLYVVLCFHLFIFLGFLICDLCHLVLELNFSFFSFILKFLDFFFIFLSKV